MGTVLIVNNNRMLCSTLGELLERMGHSVISALTLKSGLELAITEGCDAVLLDVRMPDGNGLEAISDFREMTSHPEVIIITGYGNSKDAEIAIRNGAWDYIETQASVSALILSIDRVLQYRSENHSQSPQDSLKRERIVGDSPKMKACLKLLGQAAVSGANVLITGETGTGKELFARAIHSNSPRADKRTGKIPFDSIYPKADKNFVVVDCTVMPETLVESVLFGHEKGAFTGADRMQEGLFKQADGGTLFLDEIGELPISIQKNLLRVLQEKMFRPVGGKKEIASNFRLIAATNRDIDQMVNEGKFRADLLFRLRSLSINLPPLCERVEDIRPMVVHHMSRLCRVYNIEEKEFAPDVLDIFEAYEWPGNVRELVNTIDGMLAIAHMEATLYVKHLPLHIRVKMVCDSFQDKPPQDTLPSNELSPSMSDSFPTFKDFRSSTEKKYLEGLMLSTHRNIQKSCKLSGISRSRLYELLSKYEINNSAYGYCTIPIN